MAKTPKTGTPSLKKADKTRASLASETAIPRKTVAPKRASKSRLSDPGIEPESATTPSERSLLKRRPAEAAPEPPEPVATASSLDEPVTAVAQTLAEEPVAASSPVIVEAPPQPITATIVERKLVTLDAAEQRRRVATAAYFRAERRGFVPGYELEDWLTAERQLAASTTDS